MIKDTHNKTKGNKKHRYTASEVAEICGVSESYVKQIRSRAVNLNTDKASLVVSVDEILYQGGSKLIREVERIVKL